MLTDEQLETLADAVEALDVAYPSDKAAAAAAIADMNAMRTPITAEALVQAGWYQDGSGVFNYPAAQSESIWSIQIVCNEDRSLDLVKNIDGCALENVRTMHDLAELVRLLGGAK